MRCRVTSECVALLQQQAETMSRHRFMLSIRRLILKRPGLYIRDIQPLHKQSVIAPDVPHSNFSALQVPSPTVLHLDREVFDRKAESLGGNFIKGFTRAADCVQLLHLSIIQMVFVPCLVAG